MDKTINTKYVFLDIVGYTKNRSVESQSHIIEILNKVVKTSLDYFKINEIDRILIPTGDGIYIALLNIEEPIDIHIQIALKILELLKHYNNSELEEMKRFNVRVCINENTDNLIIDINGNRNIAGAGINDGQRIMDYADGANILVGQAVYNRLHIRERYFNKFRKFQAVVKHNINVEFYQLVDLGIGFLNSGSPSVLISKDTKEEQQFSRLIAYLIYHILKNKEFIVNHAGGAENNTPLFVLMSLLAKQSIEEEEISEFESRVSLLPNTLEEEFEHLKEINYYLLLDYADIFFKLYITPYWGGSYFQGNKYFLEESHCLEISDETIEKLRKEWPEIFNKILEN